MLVGRGVRFGRGVRIGRENNSADPATIWPTAMVQYVRSDMGITLAGNLKLTGTSPAATITGSLTTSTGLRVVITTGATLASGNMRFAVYSDGGVTPVASGLVGAASVALSGVFNGITVNFAAGAYVVSDYYDATVATWADQIPVGTPKNYTVGGGAPVMVTNVAEANGQPGIKFTAANSDWLTSALQLVAPGTTPYFISFVFRSDVHVAAAQIISGSGSIGNSNGAVVMVGSGSTTGRYQQASPTAANTCSTILQGSAGNLQAYFSNSTNDYLRVGAGVKANVSGSQTSAGNTLSDISRRIGTNRNATAFADITAVELIYILRDITDFERLSYNAYLARRYGI